MMRLTLVILLFCAMGLAAIGQEEDMPEYYRAHALRGGDFDAFVQKLRQSLVNPQGVLVFEGLPHPLFEREAFTQEQAAKKTIKLHGAVFYEPPQKTELAKPVAEAVADCLIPFRGEKLCGGFHADFAIIWRSGEERWDALFCYGCGEAAIFSSTGATLRADQGNKVLKEWLKQFSKLRPQGQRPAPKRSSRGS